MIWMNNELSETEAVVLERVFHVGSYDHFVICEPFESTSYEFSDCGSRSVASDKVNSLVPSGVSHTAVTEPP